MSDQTITELLGEDLGPDGLGEDLSGPSLIAGYIPDRSIVYIPPMQLGDGLAGPPNDQAVKIYRDSRPIATDELGMQGPFTLPAVARHRAGRRFPLNYEWGAGLDPGMPGLVPEQDVLRPSPFDPGQEPAMHAGVSPPEILPTTYTIPYTASPNVGWDDFQ